MEYAVVWFRSDLRVADNPALWNACQTGKSVIAIWCKTAEQWNQHDLGPRKTKLIQSRVAELQRQLNQRHIPLWVLDTRDFCGSVTAIQGLLASLNKSSLYFNLEYELNERKRDIALCQWAKSQQIPVFKYHDQCLIPPGEVLSKSQSMFKVFSPFKRAWLKQSEAWLRAPLPAPEPQTAISEDQRQSLWSQIQTDISNLAPVIEPCSAEDEHWSVSEPDAHETLNRFVQRRIEHYQLERDFPGLDHTSRLSVPLSLGILSVRQCFWAVAQLRDNALPDGRSGTACWVSELVWREFYRHLLVAFPELCKHKAFKPETEQVRWRDSESDFIAWCEGKTGYPIVDAAQKQLVEQGWMHNRLRMISAMFLTKHLLIDWRKGEAFFNYHLLDADLASNNGGWQWSASTGADGAPYFRIFNPITQSKRFDAEGEFIRRYVPELQSIPASAIHQPSPFERQLCGYPDEIVEHSYARQRALDAFKSVSPEKVEKAQNEHKEFSL